MTNEPSGQPPIYPPVQRTDAGTTAQPDAGHAPNSAAGHAPNSAAGNAPGQPYPWPVSAYQQAPYHQAAPHQASPHQALPPQGSYQQARHPQQFQPVAAPPASAAGAHAPAAGAPTSAATAGAPASGAPAAATAEASPRRRTWPAVAASALLAAVLASGGTALASGTFDQRAGASGYTQLGTTAQVNVNSTKSVEWQAIASQVRDSVVALTVTTASGQGAGSGVVIDSDNGYVVTNNHVVSGATSGGITVTLADGRIFPATIVGTDPTTDLAVVQLTDAPSDLLASPWGDSAAVLVGQDVMAVGNPLGLASTVTTGIVSAVDRPVSTTGEDGSGAVVTNAIQIDAAINPGNSGGPLFNAAGEVIGINSSIATMSSSMMSQSGSIGLGFAIPANQAQDVVSQLISDGAAQHAFLGVTLSDSTATADGVTRAGAKVESVSSDTPAAAAGLRSGDVVVGINAKAVGGAESLTGYVRQFGAGDEVTLTLVRGSEAIDVNVTLAERPVSTGATTPQGGEDEGRDQGSQGFPGQGEDDGSGQTPDRNGNGWPQLPGFGFGNNG